MLINQANDFFAYPCRDSSLMGITLSGSLNSLGKSSAVARPFPASPSVRIVGLCITVAPRAPLSSPVSLQAFKLIESLKKYVFKI
jgi:hypothetical protein